MRRFQPTKSTLMLNLTVPEDASKLCGRNGFNETTGFYLTLPCGIPPSVVQRAALMSIFMVVALIGNVVVLTTLYRAKAWRLPVSAFVIALAATDILIALFSMPTELFWEIFGGWLFGNFACKMLTYVQCTLFASTSFIHMAISYDRYEAVCKPTNFSERTTRNRWMILVSWICAVVVAIPQLFIFQQVFNSFQVTVAVNAKKEIMPGKTETGFDLKSSKTFACKSTGYTAEWQRKLYVTWNAVYLFALPVSLILFCYIKIARAVWKCSRQKPTEITGSLNPDSAICTPADGLIISSTVNKQQRDRKLILSRAKVKTIKVTVWILFLYTFCWIPYFAVSLLDVWSDYQYKAVINSSPVATLALCLCWFSSCLNPIIYGFFSLSVNQFKIFMTFQWARRKTGSHHTTTDSQRLNSNMAPSPTFPLRLISVAKIPSSWTSTSDRG